MDILSIYFIYYNTIIQILKYLNVLQLSNVDQNFTQFGLNKNFLSYFRDLFHNNTYFTIINSRL